MYVPQTSKIVGSVVAGLLLLASAPVLAGVVGDDFNDNDKNVLKWNNDILSGVGTNVFLTETRGRLEFTGEPSSTNVYSIVRPWGAGFGSSTQDWEIAADINLGGVTLSQDGTGVKIFLVVADAANITNNYLTFGLNLERTAGVTEFSYETDATMGKSSSRYQLATLNQSDRVSIVYNSSAQTLGVYWSGGAMRADDLLGDNKRLISEWNMTANSNFVIGLGGGIYGCTNNGQEVWADNFSFNTISTTNRYAGTYSGTYSGDVTGTWQMGIDNSGRILGIAQNGSLGYSISGNVQPDGTLAFVAADNRADFSGKIDALWAVFGTWTSLYVGSGVFSGQRTLKPLPVTLGNDDFNDNDKNLAKWGDDVLFGPGLSLQEANDHLQFSGSGDTAIVRPWIYNYGSYTSSWEVAADVHVGTLELKTNNCIDMFLAVGPSNRALTNDNFTVSLEIGLDSFGAWRGYGSEMTTNGLDMGFFWAPTSELQGKVSITFDATTKELTSYYNGIQLSKNVVPDSWGMTESSTFRFVLGGSLGSATADEPFDGMTYSGTDVYADNFSFNAPGADIPLPSYVVTFDGQSGTAPIPSSTIVTNGLTYGTLANTTREGYTFAGWWTEVNGGGTPVTAETNVTITTAQTLYAKWILDLYAITHFGPQETRESKPYWHLTFQSVSNNAYVIQVAPTVTGAWLTVSEPLVAVSNRIQVLVRMLESMPQAFYRVCTSTALVPDTYTLGFDLPDQWVDRYDWTTLPPEKSALRNAADDPDGDGMNNQSEMAAGTDPTDSRSCLRMLSFNVKDALLSGDIQTTTGRIYYVESMWPQGSVWRPITGLIDGQNQKSAWQIPQPPEAQAGLFRAILAVPSEMTINPSLVGPAAVRRPLQ